MQVEIKQNIEKFLDKDTSLSERIRSLFRKQGITKMSKFNTLSMISSTTLAITGMFGGLDCPTASPPKDEGGLDKMSKRDSRCS